MMARRLKKLKITEISGVDRGAGVGTRVVLRKAYSGPITIRKDGQSWVLPADHDGPLDAVLELARKQGYQIEGDQSAPIQEQRKMTEGKGTRKAMVAVAKSFAETGEMPVEIQKRDVYAAIVKGAAKTQTPGQTADQAFARYIESAEGASLFRLHKVAPGPDWAQSQDVSFMSAWERDQWARTEHNRKAQLAAADRDARAEAQINAVAMEFWRSGRFGSIEAAREAAMRTPQIRRLRSQGNIYRDTRTYADTV